MYIPLNIYYNFSSQLSVNHKSDHTPFSSFISVFREFPPSIITHAIRRPNFSIFYDFSLNCILLLLRKILKSDRNEYYGICIANSCIPFVSEVP